MKYRVVAKSLLRRGGWERNQEIYFRTHYGGVRGGEAEIAEETRTQVFDVERGQDFAFPEGTELIPASDPGAAAAVLIQVWEDDSDKRAKAESLRSVLETVDQGKSLLRPLKAVAPTAAQILAGLRKAAGLVAKAFTAAGLDDLVAGFELQVTDGVVRFGEEVAMLPRAGERLWLELKTKKLRLVVEVIGVDV